MVWSLKTEAPVLEDGAVFDFIKKYDNLFNGDLSKKHYFGRVVSLAHFDFMVNNFNIKKQTHVGVIAGDESEPELKLLDVEKLTILNRGEWDDFKYDLDKDWSNHDSHNFTMTICNQVLEHVPNAHRAFKNICHHTASGGFIYISLPTISAIHSDPEYFISGYHPRFLKRIGEANNLEVLEVGFWGNYKNLINAVSGRSLTERQLRKGIHSRHDLKFPQLIFKDGRLRRSPKFMTDCWGLFRKR